MSRSGASVDPECVTAYNELKLGRTLKYVIYKLSDDYKEIVVEEKSGDGDWDNFRQKLLTATASSKGKTGKGPRYAVYDFEYELPGGDGRRNKLVFLSWSPDEGALIMPKMTYASSKEALKQTLSGISTEVQANNDDDLEYDAVLNAITRGKR